MRVVLLEPGFEDNNSHHASVNSEIVSKAQQQNIPVFVLASSKYRLFLPKQATQQGVPTENVITFFDTPCYTNQLNALDATTEQVLAQQFCRELQKACNQQLIKHDDVLIIHSCFSFHILGLAMFFQRIRFTGKLIVCAMFYPGTERIKRDSELAYYKWYLRYKLAFAMLKRSRLRTESTLKNDAQLILASSCQEYIEAYERCAQLPVHLHPAINYIKPKQQTPRSASISSKKRVILYLGNLKFDKGINTLVTYLRVLLETFADITFFVQFNQDSPSAHNFSAHQNEIFKLSNEFANLELHLHALSVQEYEKQLAISHALVLMYDQSAYEYKTSGLLWDVTRHPHLRLFCPQGIWAEREYNAMGGQAVSFIPITSEDVETRDKPLKPEAIDLINKVKQWQHQTPQSLELNEYGKKITQSFASWCIDKALKA